MSITPPAPRAERWPVPLLVLLTLAGLVFGFARTEAPEDRLEGTEISVGSATSAEEAEEDLGAAEPETGELGSFWSPANLRTALAAMRAKAGNAERMTSLRVDGDYLVAEYARGKERRYVYADRSGRVDLQSTRIGNPDDRAIAVGDVDPAAPDRVRRRIARIARVAPGKVDYLVLLLTIGNAPYWVGYLDQESDYDRQLNPFEARLDGSRVRAAGPKAPKR